MTSSLVDRYVFPLFYEYIVGHGDMTSGPVIAADWQTRLKIGTFILEKFTFVGVKKEQISDWDKYKLQTQWNILINKQTF